MPTFTVTYMSDKDEDSYISSSDDLQGAEPPFLDGLDAPSEIVEEDLDLKDAGPPAIAASETKDEDSGLGDAGPPPIGAMAPITESDDSGPPAVESLK